MKSEIDYEDAKAIIRNIKMTRRKQEHSQDGDKLSAYNLKQLRHEAKDDPLKQIFAER